MALEGIKYGTTSNKYMYCYIRWSATQNYAENYSTITADLIYYRGNTGYTTYGNWVGWITVDDQTSYHTSYITIEHGKDTLAMRATFKVPHNNDGSKTISVSCGGSIAGTTLGSTDCSFTAVLDKIPRYATITSAPNFTDEDNPTITYSNLAQNSIDSLQACISFNGSKDDIAYRDISKTGSSYTFNLTDAERTVLRKAAANNKSISVLFYVRTIISGAAHHSTLSKTLTIVNAEPKLAPTVEDTDIETLALTGNKNTIVKYFSDAKVVTGATVYKEATIKSQKATNGANNITTATGTFTDVESGTFVFSVTDSRGYTTTQTVNKTFIDYVKLTSNVSAKLPTTAGDLTFTIKGNYYNGSFGAEDNVLILLYRYKSEDDEDYGEWITATAPTLSSNTYSSTNTITGLDYRLRYTVQARAADKLITIESAEQSVKATPVFEWGSSDFQFNVPVIYQEDRGDAFSLSGAAKALTNTYALATTYEIMGDYSEFSGSNAVLLGGNLRCHFSCKRIEATGAGNVANEIIGTVSIKHSGKIRSSYRVNFTSGATGNIATFQTTNENNDGEYLTFDIQLLATHAADTAFTGYFIMPCALNLDAY